MSEERLTRDRVETIRRESMEVLAMFERETTWSDRSLAYADAKEVVALCDLALSALEQQAGEKQTSGHLAGASQCSSGPEVTTDAVASHQIGPSDLSPLPWSTYTTKRTANILLDANRRIVAEYIIDQDAEYITHAANAYPKLVQALRNAERGMDLAYTALERDCSDEALLHLGHHGTKADAVLRELGELSRSGHGANEQNGSSAPSIERDR